jgi:hypothetical protein
LKYSKRTLSIIFVTFLLVFEMFAYTATAPRNQDQYFQLYVLGASGSVGGYYPHNSTDLFIGDTARWYVGVTNSMGLVQLVEVRIKLGNSTIAGPDIAGTNSSVAQQVDSSYRFLRENETWEFPLFWKVTNASINGNTTTITQLQMGNQTVGVDISAVNASKFRMIIELWTLDASSDSFQYGWMAGPNHHAAWLQVWFNVTTTLGS